jgi:hypothetical protein
MRSLQDKIDALSPGARKMIERIVDAAAIHQEKPVNSKHWLVSNDFQAIFGMRLAMYHAVTRCPVNKTTFESILSESCTELGMSAVIPSSHTAVVDLVVENKRVALKSEGKIHEKVHISKFCELGWGSWECSRDLYYKIHNTSKTDTNRTFESRLSQYDLVLTLRHNDSIEKMIAYELIEIPTSVLKRILDIPMESYNEEFEASKSKTIPKSCNIKIPWINRESAKEIIVKFDGGGERKLTITVPLEACVRLATWDVFLIK